MRNQYLYESHAMTILATADFYYTLNVGAMLIFTMRG